MDVNRGDIFWMKMPGVYPGSVQRGDRPVVVIQNDIGNLHSQTTIVAALGHEKAMHLPTHVPVVLKKKSAILCEQVFTVNKWQLEGKAGRLSKEQLAELDEALAISFGLK